MDNMNKMIKINDIIMAVSIFAVLAIIIVPLPPFILDMFMAINISIAVLLLGTALFLNRPIDLAILPTVILATTLFRLSLNIASTRMILSHGEAGQIIATFGETVASGNPIVGFILFVVITIVQFLVITKGAERIAEVSARFTLDAMPGKQMAIDAELNMGMITPEVAQTRRKDLERESALFGSMDGASKFVKGDAIAGIIITIVNMIAGLAIGVLQRGLELGYAAKVYMILSIGDALGAQVPALISSVATALIVTRSTSSGQSLSTDVIEQFLSNPMAIIVGGILFSMMGLMPGMPWYFFFPIGAFFIWSGYQAIQAAQVKENMNVEEQIQQQTEPPKSPDQMYNLLGVDALAIHVGNNLIPLADPANGGRLIDDVGSLRQHLTLTLGYILPPVRICDSRHVGPYEYRILVRGNVVAGSEIYPQRYMILKSHWEQLYREPPPNALNGWEPVQKEPAYWVQPELIESLIREGRWNKPYATPIQVITFNLSETVFAQIDEMLTKVDVRRILDKVRSMDPALVDGIVPAIIGVGELRKVLVNLLKEKVSIRDIHYILERIEDINASGLTREPDLITEKLRLYLSRQICTHHASDKKLLAITVGPEIEQLLEESLQKVEDKYILTPDPQLVRSLMGDLTDASNQLFAKIGRRPVVLCSAGLRLPLSRLIESFDSQIPVMSYEELVPDFKVEVVKTLESASAEPNALGSAPSLDPALIP